LLWIVNVPRFGVSSNEVIKKIVNKYLTMDETIIKINKIVMHKFINMDEHVEKMSTYLLISLF
jgi:hypothetical protein